jgi:hypothetical protein
VKSKAHATGSLCYHGYGHFHEYDHPNRRCYQRCSTLESKSIAVAMGDNQHISLWTPSDTHCGHHRTHTVDTIGHNSHACDSV